MSHALRNTLTLGIILLLTGGTGLYWTAWHQADRITALALRHTALQTELDGLHAITAQHASAQAAVDSLQACWDGRTQLIPATDTPTRTLAYLDELQQLAGGTLSFDMIHLGHQEATGYSTNRYAVKGEAPFKDLYAFTHLLEYGRLFYTLDGLEIIYQEPDHGIDGGRDRWVQFCLLFSSYYAQPTRSQADPVLVNKPIAGALADPFRPLITRAVPSNTRGLFDIAGARLQALTQQTAYITDRNGSMTRLSAGDPVYLGRLDAINITTNTVEFLLNKGGIWQRVSLAMEPATKRTGGVQ